MSVMTPSPSDRHDRRERWLLLALLAPALAIVLLLLIVPLGWLGWQSLRDDSGFTLIHYERFLSDPVYWKTFLQTFRIALTVTLAAVLLGYPVAYVAAGLPGRWGMLVLAMVLLPFWTSVLVRAYAWLILLQRTGLVNSALKGAGLIDTPLPW
ncbi:MAG: hypothetical protein U5N10_02610 [Gemmobacter sp.]|nr:hypothetical protein [Gemmobacter sp.]